mmetsp:Transcript_59770/g.128826  ORF Transcript_59770/g.128826 Transcript_59770/m.128826 type:complete len:176 (-) Transcript_59770:200-727(-)
MAGRSFIHGNDSFGVEQNNTFSNSRGVDYKRNSEPSLRASSAQSSSREPRNDGVSSPIRSHREPEASLWTMDFFRWADVFPSKRWQGCGAGPPRIACPWWCQPGRVQLNPPPLRPIDDQGGALWTLWTGSCKGVVLATPGTVCELTAEDGNHISSFFQGLLAQLLRLSPFLSMIS